MENLVHSSLHFDFVTGLKGAIPATAENLVHMKNSIPPGTTWSAASIGPARLPINTMTMLMDGHRRVGLEDNIHFRMGELAGTDGDALLLAPPFVISETEIAFALEAIQKGVFDVLGSSPEPRDDGFS
jgi:uncharacterized protein (DUF849 family)